MAKKQPEPIRSDARSPQKITAKQLCKATGLTYRKLNDWDGRGLVPHRRDGDLGWREFTLLEVIALRIIVDLKREVGVPPKKMKHLRHWLLGEPWDDPTYDAYDTSFRRIFIKGAQEIFAETDVSEFEEEDREAFRRLATKPPEWFGYKVAAAASKYLRRPYGDDPELRRAVWWTLTASGPIVQCMALIANGRYVTFCTDFHTGYMFLDEMDLSIVTAHGLFEDSSPLLFPVNRSVNQALLALGLDALPRDKVREKRRERPQLPLMEEEQELFETIRGLHTGTVVASVKDGRLDSYERQETHDTSKLDLRSVLETLVTDGHETVTLKKAPGKILRVERSTKRRFGRNKKPRVGGSKPSPKR